MKHHAKIPPVLAEMIIEGRELFDRTLAEHEGACPPETIVAAFVERWLPQGASLQLRLIVVEYFEHLVSAWCGADRAETFRYVPPAASAETYRQAGAARLLDAGRGLVCDPLAGSARPLH